MNFMTLPCPSIFNASVRSTADPIKTQPPRGGNLSTSYRHLGLAHARHPLFQLFFESGPGKWFHLTPQPGFWPGPAAALTPSMRGGEPTNINARAFIALRFSSAHIPSLCRLYDQVCRFRMGHGVASRPSHHEINRRVDRDQAPEVVFGGSIRWSLGNTLSAQTFIKVVW